MDIGMEIGISRSQITLDQLFILLGVPTFSNHNALRLVYATSGTHGSCVFGPQAIVVGIFCCHL
jgi:hypothetical protein